MPATLSPQMPEPLAHAVDDALHASPRRVQRLTAGGRVFWLKRPERLSLWWRLQKGDPQRTFRAEREALHELADRGLPVADLVAEDADFIVTADAGESLREVLRDQAVPPAGRLAAFRAAGRSLAVLHRAALRHGRPSIRDICWDGRMARFIDFEKFRRGPVSRRGMGLDLLIFVHSVFAVAQMPVPELDEALAAYRAAAPEGAWAAAESMARHLGWLAALARMVLRWHPSRDLAAVPLTVERMRGDAPHGQAAGKARQS
ncbi:MAG: lipopolysaccharide kinase InaA family protein [Paracoccaceae bacterium]